MSCFCTEAGHCPWHKAVVDGNGIADCKNGQPPLPASPMPCLYLGKDVGEGLYDCRIHNRCTLTKPVVGNRVASCQECKDYLPPTAVDLATRFVDPLYITDRWRNPTNAMRNYLAGGSAFLVCGGPSLKLLDYSKLSERGVFSLGVNNVAGLVRVSAFVCSDPPKKFHHGVFCDPKILKFLPIPKLKGRRGSLRYKNADGAFMDLGRGSSECPATFGFERRSWLMPDRTWFTQTSAAWGNHDAGVRTTGQPKTVCTMLLGLRILQYLGARRIFLLGVDFNMDPSLKLTQNYAFPEDRDKGACESNNRQYNITNKWLCELRPVFEEFGFYTFNCNARSRLEAFDYVPFERALEICRGWVPQEPFDLRGFYAKK